MNLPRATLKVAVCLVAVAGLSVTPVMAMNVAPANGGGGDPVVECDYGVFHDTAVIEYGDVGNGKLWKNAGHYAQWAINKCDLDGRQKREVAGEIRAHASGEYAPGPLNPGETIDIAGSGADPQEDVFGWLMSLPDDPGPPTVLPY